MIFNSGAAMVLILGPSYNILFSIIFYCPISLLNFLCLFSTAVRAVTVVVHLAEMVPSITDSTSS